MAKLLQKVNRHEKSICGKCSHRFVCFGIDNQPCFECNQFTEEVVRCKDCKNRIYSDFDGCYICHHGGFNSINESHFCFYGERRTDDRS